MKNYTNITNQDLNIHIVRIILQAILTFPKWTFSTLLRNLELVKEKIDNKKVIGWYNEEYLPTEELLKRVDPYNSLLKTLAQKQPDNKVLLLAILEPEILGQYIAQANMQPTLELKAKKLIELCNNHFNDID